MLFGRADEELTALEQAKIEYEIVPGNYDRGRSSSEFSPTLDQTRRCAQCSVFHFEYRTR